MHGKTDATMSDFFSLPSAGSSRLLPPLARRPLTLSSSMDVNRLLSAPIQDFHYLGTSVRPLRGLLTSPQSTNYHTPDLYEQIADLRTLERAWQTLQARGKKPSSQGGFAFPVLSGGLSASNQEVAIGLSKPPSPEFIHTQLVALHEQLLEGTYRPAPLIRLTLSQRHKNKSRDLRVPIMRDRIVERAIVDVISPLVEHLHSPCSFGFRPGLGVTEAVDHVVTLRDWGHGHVLRADFRRFFPSIRLELFFSHLAGALPCPRTLFLIRLVASPRRAHGERRTRSRGLAQGSSLSPLLSNLALTDFDRAVSQAGFGYARFADDFLVCAESEQQILYAVDLIQELAQRFSLHLNEEKTMVSTFDEGFAFLNREFSASEPRVSSVRSGKRSPDHSLYIARQDARLRLSKGRLLVEGSDLLPLMSVPQKTVSRVVVTGTVGVSAGVRSWALASGVPIVFLSRRGHFLGTMEGKRSERDAQRLVAQVCLSQDEARRLPLARALVTAKIRQQINLIYRMARRTDGVGVQDAVTVMRTLIDEATCASHVEELLGIEGATSSAYFGAVSRLLPSELGFEGRNRRPPRDVTNAALSYGYAMLLSECTGALAAAGLEPSLGVLHSSTGKRPSLALDLMEEFRPLLVDRTVFALARSKRLRVEHGTAAENSPEGVWLNRAGKKALVDGYEATLQRSVKGALPGFAGSWRRHILHEAQLLARAIVEPDMCGRGWRGDDACDCLRHFWGCPSNTFGYPVAGVGLPCSRVGIPGKCGW